MSYREVKRARIRSDDRSAWT